MSDPGTLVVGASAAGALTAYLVAASGHRVRLVDESPEPGHEERTLIVTDRMLSVIDPDLASRCIRSRVERFEMFANGALGAVELARADLVIERSILVADLLRAAESAGAEVMTGHRFEGFASGGRVTLLGPDGPIEMHTPVVVGADGSSSAVAREVGIRHEHLSLLQAIVTRPKDLLPNTSRVWFMPDTTRYFFWMIPEGDSDVAVGLISDDRGKTRSELDRFLHAKGLESKSYQAARVPRYRRWIPIHRRHNDRDVYLVGDAAAQVKISTVGGVVTGLRGAAVAASMIGGSRPSAAGARLRWELGLHALIRRALQGFDEKSYCELLNNLSGRTRDALGSTSRDAAMLMLVRSLATSPRIAVMGLRGLMRHASA